MKKTYKLAINIFVLGISFFALSKINAFANEEYVRDTLTNEVIMTYDKDTREIVVSEVLNDNKDIMDKVLRVCDYEGKNEQKNFYETYGFLPRKITCDSVIYEYSGTSFDGTLTITSVGGKEIKRACVEAFDVKDRYVQGWFGRIKKYAEARCKVKKLFINGKELTYIPDKCFSHMQFLEELHLENIGIKNMKSFGYRAFDDCHISFIQVPELFEVKVYKEKDRRFLLEDNAHLSPLYDRDNLEAHCRTIRGNLSEKIRHEIEEINRAEEEERLRKEEERRRKEEQEKMQRETERREARSQYENERAVLKDKLKEIEMNGGPKDEYERMSVDEYRSKIKMIDAYLDGLDCIERQRNVLISI